VNVVIVTWTEAFNDSVARNLDYSVFVGFRWNWWCIPWWVLQLWRWHGIFPNITTYRNRLDCYWRYCNLGKLLINKRVTLEVREITVLYVYLKGMTDLPTTSLVRQQYRAFVWSCVVCDNCRWLRGDPVSTVAERHSGVPALRLHKCRRVESATWQDWSHSSRLPATHRATQGVQCLALHPMWVRGVCCVPE